MQDTHLFKYQETIGQETLDVCGYAALEISLTAFSVVMRNLQLATKTSLALSGESAVPCVFCD